MKKAIIALAIVAAVSVFSAAGFAAGCSCTISHSWARFGRDAAGNPGHIVTYMIGRHEIERFFPSYHAEGIPKTAD